MSTSTGFEAFTLFNAIHLHFTSKYDYFKYQGKVRLTKDNFEKNKAKFSYYRVSRKYSFDEMRELFVANFVYGDDVKWIGDVTDDPYKKWQKINQSLTYSFENDIIGMFERYDSPNKLLAVRNGQHPHLLQHVMSDSVKVETVVILNDLLNFIPKWDTQITDDIIWPIWKKKIEKYTPFMNYDKKKFKDILINQMDIIYD